MFAEGDMGQDSVRFLSRAQPFHKKYFFSRICVDSLCWSILVARKSGFVGMNIRNMFEKNCDRFWAAHHDVVYA